MSQHLQEKPQHNQHLRSGAEILTTQEGPRLSEETLRAFASRLHGEMIRPEDADYEAARAVWHGGYDRHPALIVRCLHVADVIAAVQFAREQKLPLSVRSGGHSLSGHGTNDGGVVIDLSRMKAISIDPTRRTARLEPGLTWHEVSHALQPSGLALTSGDTATVGVGGLLLGGGIGWMVRKYGLACDRVRAVELVTAEGHLLRASASDHRELFWGLRGGGGNFGIATAFEVDLHAGGTILGGAVFYEAGEAERILRAYARIALAAPDELTTQALLMPAPPAPFVPPDKQGTPSVALVFCYAGDIAEGEQVVAPLRALGTPIAEMVAPMPYPALFAFTEVAEIRGWQHHVRSAFLETLPDEMLHALAESACAIISPGTIVQLRVLGGAMSRVPNDATAFAHRDKQAMLLIEHYGPLPADAADLHARTEQVWQAISPYASGVYVNLLGDEGEQRIHDAYPPATYARLAALKRRYDPQNLFHLNQNIPPGEG